jgi:hypothetical protein
MVKKSEAIEGEVISDEKDVPNETKAEKFVRLSKARMPKVLKAISMLENLGTSSYESTPDQRVKILRTLKDAVERVDVALNKPKKSADDLGFDFD